MFDRSPCLALALECGACDMHAALNDQMLSYAEELE